MTPASLDHAALYERFARLNPGHNDIIKQRNAGKRNVARGLIAQGMGSYAVAVRVGVSRSTAQRWIDQERKQA